MNRFVPWIAGEQCAQDIMGGVRDPKARVSQYGWQLRDHYDETGMMGHDQRRALGHISRHMLRAISAPLIFKAELRLQTLLPIAQQTLWSNVAITSSR